MSSVIFGALGFLVKLRVGHVLDPLLGLAVEAEARALLGFERCELGLDVDVARRWGASCSGCARWLSLLVWPLHVRWSLGSRRSRFG